MDISIKVTYKSEGLQKLRKAAGLSQSQLADLAGIKVQVLQQYERGAIFCSKPPAFSTGWKKISTITIPRKN